MADLRELAEKSLAANEPDEEAWYTADSLRRYAPLDGDHPDAQFIAACDPQTVIALLDERDRLLGDRARLREALLDAVDRHPNWLVRATRALRGVPLEPPG